MDIAAILAYACSTQLAGEPISSPAAEARLKTEVVRHVTDPDVHKKIPLLLLRLRQQKTPTVELVDLMAQRIVRQHYAQSTSKILPFNDPIVHPSYGSVSLRDGYRVFQVLHGDFQDDGWSCGLRSDLTAAGFQSSIQSGKLLLSDEEIGEQCKAMRLACGGLKGSIEYIILRSKLDAVCSLLKAEQSNIDSTLELLGGPDPNIYKVFLSIHPDYFIQRQSLVFLRNPPHIFHAVALLGKAYRKEVKAVGDELVDLLLEEYMRQKGSFVDIDRMIDQLCVHVPQGDADLKSLHIWARDKERYRSCILALCLASGPVAMRKRLLAISQSVPPLMLSIEALKQEFMSLDAALLDSAKIDACREGLRKSISQLVTRMLEKLWSFNPSLRALKEAIERSDCPFVASAMALFPSSDPVNDDIIGLLKKSTKPEVAHALMHIGETQHAKIHECVGGINALLEIFLKDNLVDILNTLRTVQAPQVQRAIELLSGKEDRDPQLEKILRQARLLLLEADTQKLREALRIIDPQYPDLSVGVIDAHVLHDLQTELNKLKDPLVGQCIELLNKASTQQEALGAVPLLEKITRGAVKEARALLESDHTVADWNVGNEYPLARERIAGIKNTLPQVGEYADPDHLIKLSGMPALGLSADHVHILGDFTQQGQLLFNLSDGICAQTLTDFQRNQLEACEGPEAVSRRVEEAIREHFKTHYVDPHKTGVHHFICNIKRPCLHWIYIGLVKLSGKKPILVVLDSKNFPISVDVQSPLVGTDTMVAFLYNRFIRPFD